MNVETKILLLNKCLEYLDKRIELESSAIDRAKKEAAGEEKSSAGDKYETGRAMMHLEQEKYARQLQQTIDLKKSLLQIDFKKKYDTPQPGSLVCTDKENFFFAVSADDIELNDEEYLPLSFASPLGQAFINKKEGETVSFRGVDYNIIKIY